MSTIMPGLGPIRISPDRVAEMRRLGRGSLLVWDQSIDVVTVAGPGTRLAPTEMIIAGSADLAIITERAAQRGRVCDDTAVATVLTSLAAEQRAQWHRVKSLTTALIPLRRMLAGAGVFLDGPPVLVGSRIAPRLCDHYRRDAAPAREVAVTTANLGHPAEAAIADPDTRETLWHQTFASDGRTPHEVAEAMGAEIIGFLAAEPAHP